jgi:hypothetical protein
VINTHYGRRKTINTKTKACICIYKPNQTNQTKQKEKTEKTEKTEMKNDDEEENNSSSGRLFPIFLLYIESIYVML